MSASDGSSASCVTSTSVDCARAPDVEQQIHDVPPGRRVQVARRLVGQDDRRIVGERAGDRDALLLPAGQLRRIVVRAIGQADLLQQLPRAGGGVAPAGNLHRHQHVLERGQRRHQVEELEDEPDLLAAQTGEAVLGQTS